MMIKRLPSGKWAAVADDGTVEFEDERHDRVWCWLDKRQREHTNASEKRHEWGFRERAINGT